MLAAEMASTIPTPPKLLILPEDRSSEARICTLAHPRTSNPSRYLFDPEKGIYEFTKVAAPKSTCRSWLIGKRKRDAVPIATERDILQRDIKEQPSSVPESQDSPSNGDKHAYSRPVSDGYIVKNAELIVATPIDSLFLLLPCFANSSSDKSHTKALFLSADDILEKLSEDSKHLSQILRCPKLRLALEERMQVVCDTVDAGDEKMYRLSEGKFLAELVLKAKAMVAFGLPPSMEERFIRKALETPVMVGKREESSLSEANPQQNDAPISESTPSEFMDSQASIASTESTVSAATDITVPDEAAPSTVPVELYNLLRLRTALSYMISSYIPTSLAARLNTILASESSLLDFKSLDEHLASIAELRAEALAARSLGDFSRKRSMFEEDDAAETRAEKRRKKEEEEKKKKAGETRGVRDLKKVDTKGMKKMSDFFGKRTSPRKK